MDIVGLVAVPCFFGTIIYIVHALLQGRRTRTTADPTLHLALSQAEAQAARLDERIDHLERILDEDAPGWRARSSR